MIQLTILSASRRTSAIVPASYPFCVGRAAEAGLRLQEPGIWPQHLTLDVHWADGIRLKSCPEALTTVNGRQVEETRLRNGDLIQVGPVRLRFALSPARPRGWKWREAILWACMLGLVMGQLVLIWWVLP